MFDTLIPVIVAFVALIGGGFVYGWQKQIDRKNQILSERRDLYRGFVKTVQFLQMDVRTKNRDNAYTNFTEYRSLLSQLIVTAPDQVVVPLKQLDDNFAAVIAKTFDEDRGEGLFATAGEMATADADELAETNSRLFTEVIFEMRKDTFDESEISAGNVANQYPNGW